MVDVVTAEIVFTIMLLYVVIRSPVVLYVVLKKE